MKVFITGGTGYLGSVLVEHIVAAGHDVTGLARSDRAARSLEKAGARPLPGSLADVAALKSAAAQADATVHAAVDYSMTDEANAVELGAVAALAEGAGAAHADKPLIYTSTGLVYGFDPAQNRSEDAELPNVSALPVKVAGERLVTRAPGVAGIIFRAGLIYGRGGSGLLTGLIQAASATGTATYIGDGANAWTPVHVDDLARLYVAALERPIAGIYNATGEVPFTFRELAEAIASLTGTHAASIPVSVAESSMGPMARILTTSATTTSAKARTAFGWHTSEPPFLEDVRAGSYAAPAGPRLTDAPTH
jgi:nucleoside-diphosphate-sugar epimerase